MTIDRLRDHLAHMHVRYRKLQAAKDHHAAAGLRLEIQAATVKLRSLETQALREWNQAAQEQA